MQSIKFSKFVHISTVGEVKKLANVKQKVSRSKNTEKLSFKPQGLWFAKRGGWYKFAQINKDQQDVFIYEVIIPKDCHIAHLTTYEEAMAFQTKYGFKQKELTGEYKTFRYIDWSKVAKDYSGIYIENHKKIVKEIGLRNNNKYSNLFWLISFALDSGCIWNFDQCEVKLRLL